MEDSRQMTSLSSKKIVQTWWPLAVSWILMSLEPIVTSAVIARLSNPETNLAADIVLFMIGFILGLGDIPGTALAAVPAHPLTDSPIQV